jgi:hypothetical protein
LSYIFFFHLTVTKNRQKILLVLIKAIYFLEDRMKKQVLYRLLAIVGVVLLAGLVAVGCSSDSKGHSLSEVNTWTLSFQAGYGSDPQDVFEPLYWRQISESEWNNVKNKTMVDDANTSLNNSWSQVEARLKAWDITEARILEIKTKLAAEEKATYFYKNTSGKCRWIRIIKN